MGSTIYVSGQIGLTPAAQLAGDGGFEAQARQAYENLRRVLAAASASLADVVKTTTFLTDPTTVPRWRELRAAEPGEHQPTSTLLIVAGLADPKLLIEVEAIAVVGDG